MQSLESIQRDNFEAAKKSLRNEIDLLTKLLVALCEHIEKSPQASILITIADGEVAGWWGKHKKIEANRIAEKEALETERIVRKHEEQERKNIRDKILEKLTDEDKKILGIS